MDTRGRLYSYCYFNDVEGVKRVLNKIPQNEVHEYEDIFKISAYTPEVLKLLLEKFNPGRYSDDLLRKYTRSKNSKCINMLLKDERVVLQDYWVSYFVNMGNLKTIKIFLPRISPYKYILLGPISRKQWSVCRLLLEDERVGVSEIEKIMKKDDLFIAHQMMVLRGKSFFGISRLPKELLLNIRDFLSYIPVSRLPHNFTVLLK
jgi:hypothetical protein